MFQRSEILEKAIERINKANQSLIGLGQILDGKNIAGSTAYSIYNRLADLSLKIRSLQKNMDEIVVKARKKSQLIKDLQK